ncbi:hypothetical protein HN018_28390 (plasmid) [Lichenicola cladoniae]|uniref:Uncharacterized protein n=1 Tax=Lichenicola cladoniae TaxID=1484109 RepID=A0A6M8HZT7_9PROT|nr:hypothetical protein [Lichenicola cladoniae]NPD69781.1 hypothetical protein [Acetobacteraceae bacterium]QKE94043.1 hypothetical protein HN018_28390 [Lichenicola cladoniae]
MDEQRRHIGWWKPAEGTESKSITWPEAFELASLDWSEDPLSNTDAPRLTPLGLQDFLLNGSLLLLIACVIATGLDYVVFPHIPTLLLKYDQNAGPHFSTLVSASDNLTAYLAIFTAAIAVYVARFTIRAQVRSKSRQKWIDKVRTLISDLISDIDLVFRKEYIDLTSINKKRMQLELLLNPSEKDHRLLTMLIRVCASPGLPVKADDNLRAFWKANDMEYRIHSGAKGLIRILLLGKVSRNNKVQGEAISYVIRLSNVVLKREWERVRETQ